MHRRQCIITPESRHNLRGVRSKQGEDVVAGIRTPEPIDRLQQSVPRAYEQLVKNCKLLEQHYRDMQDIEFTVQEEKLFMLQCRSGKRTGHAAFQVAVDLVDEGLVTEDQALLLVGGLQPSLGQVGKIHY